MIHDIHRRGMAPLQFLKRLQEQGTLVDCTVETSLVGTLDDRVIINRIPLFVLMACDVSVDQAAEVFGIGRQNVYTLGEDLTVRPIAMGDYEVLTPPRMDSAAPAPRATVPPLTSLAATEAPALPVVAAAQGPADRRASEEPQSKAPEADEHATETECSSR
jgi:hypothetical protein